MKKSLLIILGLVSFFIDVNAQKGFHAGVKIIPQTVWMINKDLSDSGFFNYENKFRMAAGVSLNYHFTDKFGLGLDLLYSQQGQGYRVCPECDKELLKVDYFKLPILIHWNGDPEKVAMFVGQFGPQFMFLMNVEDTGLSFLSEEDYNSFVFGLVLGVGVGFNITDYLGATAMLRLDAGLTDAGDADTWDHTTWALTGGILEIGFKYVLRTGR